MFWRFNFLLNYKVVKLCGIYNNLIKLLIFYEYYIGIVDYLLQYHEFCYKCLFKNSSIQLFNFLNLLFGIFYQFR